MHFSNTIAGHEDALIALFTNTFTASEGAEEGARIGSLVRTMLHDTPPQDLLVFTAGDEGRIVGGIFFSRMRFAQDARTVFILGPVAVATEAQGKGIGQQLLKHGLAALRDAGVDAALTYGDPNYYMRVGFRQISEADARPPFKLQHPEGWMGQSLSERPLTPLKGASRCVAALSDPAFW
ncbi:GNAT family N-acetyltransferase [Denitromonas iodatirespirans]|uniref:N-acetyltransferase n=1 Tax=Denitromonas iodatirespirans TaxID=2795389 RepID=A0A944DH98_DENI1|nr:N-acetyltransferase [Denitromonas iodatirespirans]MBT0962838.1 N-acetyltransferase [Denitromonas iodatirespirans]